MRELIETGIAVASAGEKGQNWEAMKADLRAMTEQRDKWKERTQSYEKTNATLKRALVKEEEETRYLRRRIEELSSTLKDFREKYPTGALATQYQFEKCEKERKAYLKALESANLNPAKYL